MYKIYILCRSSLYQKLLRVVILNLFFTGMLSNLYAITDVLSHLDIENRASSFWEEEKNTAPVALCKSITVNLPAGECEYRVFPEEVNDNSYDPDGDPITLSFYYGSRTRGSIVLQPPGHGVEVWLQVSDGVSTSTCLTSVTVKEPVAPDLKCKGSLESPVNLNLMKKFPGSIGPTWRVFLNTPKLATVNDNCQGNLPLSLSQEIGTCEDVGQVLAVEFTARDASGNVSSCNAYVQIHDPEPPSISCTYPDIAAPLDINLTSSSASLDPAQLASYSDNCSVDNVNLSKSSVDCDDVGGTFRITVTASDKEGNQTSCYSYVSVKDETPPSVSCKYSPSSPLEVNLTNSSASLDVYQLADISENCLHSAVLLQSNVDCDDIGQIVPITVRVTDKGNNVNTCVSYVTVKDAQPPTISCQYPSPSTALVLNMTGSNISISPSQLVSYTDNCGIGGITASKMTFDCSDVNTFQPISVQVYDRYGNSSVCTSYVRVKDVANPTISCTYTSSSSPLEINLTGRRLILNASLLGISSNDNCGILKGIFSKNTLDCDDIGAPIAIITTVGDRGGNSASCTSYVKVSDTGFPNITCKYPDPAVPLVYSLTTAGHAFSPPELASWSDNCGVVSNSIINGTVNCDDLNSVVEIEVGAIDAAGNKSTCSSFVKVIDQTAPEMECQDAIVLLDGNGAGTLSVDQVLISSSDNCSEVNVLGLSQTAFDCAHLGNGNSVTLEIEDGNGNKNSCTIDVTVIDEIKPQLTCQNATVSLDANGAGSLTVGQVLTSSSDNCTTVNVLGFDQDAFDCSNLGVNSITLTIEDGSGNANSCTVDVNVIDEIKPQLTCQNATVSLDASGAGSLAVGQVLTSSSDNCTTVNVLGFDQDAFDCSNLGVNSITLTIEDGSGNANSCTIDVNVIDEIPPTLEVISGPIVLWPPNHKYTNIKVSNLIIDVFDNCSNLGIQDVKIMSVDSDEGDNLTGEGDGNTVDDIVIASDCASVKLRRERQGEGNGRVYTINLSVSDGLGNATPASVQVHIPYEEGIPVVDDGVVHSVLGCGNVPLSGIPQTKTEPAISKISAIGQLQAFPNPFRQGVNLQFNLPTGEKVSLHLFDHQGRIVKTLVDGSMSIGDHKIEWDGTDSQGQNLPAGMYYARLQHSLGLEITKILKIN